MAHRVHQIDGQVLSEGEGMLTGDQAKAYDTSQRLPTLGVVPALDLPADGERSVHDVVVSAVRGTARGHRGADFDRYQQARGHAGGGQGRRRHDQRRVCAAPTGRP